MIREIKLYGTTDASGEASIASALKVSGLLHAVEWIDGDLADGVGAVLSQVRDDNASDITLLTLTAANVDKVYYPRYVAQDNTGADLATAGDAQYTRAFINGKLKLVVSSGGATKSGGAIVYYEV